MPNQREASRENWTSHSTMESINSGSLQRIADAVEVMSKNCSLLLEEKKRIDKLDRRISALNGTITILNRKLLEKGQGK